MEHHAAELALAGATKIVLLASEGNGVDDISSTFRNPTTLSMASTAARFGPNQFEQSFAHSSSG